MRRTKKLHWRTCEGWQPLTAKQNQILELKRGCGFNIMDVISGSSLERCQQGIWRKDKGKAKRWGGTEQRAREKRDSGTPRIQRLEAGQSDGGGVQRRCSEKHTVLGWSWLANRKYPWKPEGQYRRTFAWDRIGHWCLLVLVLVSVVSKQEVTYLLKSRV